MNCFNILKLFTNSLVRKSSSFCKHTPKIRVVSIKYDQNLVFIFQYSNSPYLNIKAPKNQNVQKVLNRIKLMATLQITKEEVLESKITKFSVLQKDIQICLKQNNSIIDMNMSNIDAWAQASTLHIGDIVYEVEYNTPTVKSLDIPNFILCGYTICPRVTLECASLHDSIFTWYRSITGDNAKKLSNYKNSEILIRDDKFWQKVHDGLVYSVSKRDIGCFLKVVCTPKQNDEVGSDFSVQSSRVVEASPDHYFFEERQRYTKSFCGNTKIRCLSYNTLASFYMEESKYPYSSPKARDSYYRKHVLLKELLGYNCDILCLQELEEKTFECDLLPALDEIGYSGFHMKKGGRYEGQAIFFRSSKFKAKLKYGVILNQIIKDKHIYQDLLKNLAGNCKDISQLLKQDTILQVLCLEHISLPGQVLLVANTHLYSNNAKPEVRLLQAAVCTHYMEYIIKEQNLQSTGILFCGDFNSPPNSSTFKFLTSGTYEYCPKSSSNSGDNSSIVLKNTLCLGSACGTPEYTNYTRDFNGCLDYIFYSKHNLKVDDVVPMPKHEHITAQVALPNEHFPSDHIALVSTLQWNDSEHLN